MLSGIIENSSGFFSAVTANRAIADEVDVVVTDSDHDIFAFTLLEAPIGMSVSFRTDPAGHELPGARTKRRSHPGLP